MLGRLRESDQRLRLTLAATRGCALDWNLETDRITGPGFAKLLGYASDEEPESGSAFYLLVHPDDLESFQTGCRQLVEGAADLADQEVRLRTRRGEWRWFQSRCEVVARNAVGDAARIAGVFYDITGRKQTEHKLSQKDETYREFASLSSDAIGRVDFDEPIALNRPLQEIVDLILDTGYVAETNDILARVHGFGSAQEMLGVRLREVFPPERRDIREMAAQFAASGFRPMEWEVEGLDEQGAEKYFVQTLIGVVQDDKLHRLWRVARDITERKLQELALGERNARLQEVIAASQEYGGIIGESLALQALRERIEMVAHTDSTVLILGETGTGKELIARAVHGRSRRRRSLLVKIDCATLAPGLIESELFGHEKGAFSGAVAAKTGRFELADGGTIFLDEIGELPLELQPKLLRLLQEREFERVGGTRTHKVDVRVIAATNRDLREAVRAGRFREDLYYRLHVFPLVVAPLRERKEDISLLAAHFLDRFSHKLGKPLEGLTQTGIRRLAEHDWPGNVRELEHVIEHAAILATTPTVDIPRLSDRGPERLDEPRPLALADVERDHIRTVLERTNWVVGGPRGAAALLGLAPSTLRYRLHKLGLERPSGGAASRRAKAAPA